MTAPRKRHWTARLAESLVNVMGAAMLFIVFFVGVLLILFVALSLTSCASRRPVVQSVEAIDCAAERTFRADMAETIQRQQHTIDSLTALR